MKTSNNEKELLILHTKYKLKQITDIYSELLKIRDGLEKYACSVRNSLQIFSGEMELYCSINIDKEVESLSNLLSEGIDKSNWDKVNKIVLVFYEKIFSYCA